METWPAYGVLLSDQFGEQVAPNVDRTQMENSSVKQTRRGSLEMFSKPASYLYSETEYGTWKTWRRDNINRGVDWFNRLDPLDGVIKQTRIVGGDFKAGQHPPESPGGELRYVVSLTFEVLE